MRRLLPGRTGAFASGINKLHILYPVIFFKATAIGITALGLLFYVKDVFHPPVGVASMFAAVWTLSYAVSCILLRPVSSRLLPRHSLMIASSGAAACVLGILFAPSLPLAFLLYTLYGVFISFFWPPVMGWLSAGVEREALNARISYFNMAWSTGVIISPFLGGVLFERGQKLPLMVSITLFSLVALVLLLASLFLPTIRNDRHIEAPRTSASRAEDRSTPLRYPAWVILFCGYLLFGILVNVFPLFARDALGFSEGRVGLILLLRAVGTTAGFLVLGKTMIWQFRKRSILLSQALVIVSAVALLFARIQPVLLIAFLLYGFTLALIYNNSLFLGAAGTVERARRMAIHEAVLNAGAVAGSLLGGILYQEYSMEAAFGFFIVFSLIVVVFLIFVLLEFHRRGFSGRRA